MRKLARYCILAVTLIGIPVVLGLLIAEFRPEDSLGKTSSECDARGDYRAVANGSGVVVTGHTTGCVVVLLSTTYTTYVYLHRPEESDSSKSLIFRYVEGDENIADPQITWTDDVSLHISVPEVGTVTKQVSSIGPYKISYSIGKEEWSHEDDINDTRRYQEMLAANLLFLIGVCLLTLRSIRKQRMKERLIKGGESAGS